ncbi:MAG: HD-GYP domain-containing protein [Candidatus Goldiibacteriota bacterium]
MISAADVYDYKGAVLLKKNAVLTQTGIDKLKRTQIPHIYIQDDEIKINYIFDPSDEAELLDVLRHFRSSGGKNTGVLRKYGKNKLRRILDYNNDTGNNIAYGHVLKYFTARLAAQAGEAECMYDFMDYRTGETYLYFHALNTLKISLLIGARAGLNEKELVDLGVGVILADIKMGNYEFINTVRELNETEREKVRQHPAGAFEAAGRIYGLSSVSGLIALQHHERINGSGYPRGIKADKINIMSKIAAAADVYDALISPRPYRKAYMPDEAFDYISKNSGIIFDSAVAGSFKQCTAKYYPGSIVETCSGEKALVVSNPGRNPEKPDLKIIEKKNESDIIMGTEKHMERQKNADIKKTLSLQAV